MSTTTTTAPIGDALYTTEEVAEMFRASPSTIRHWRAIGTGPKCFKAGKRYLYAGEDLRAWATAKRDAAAS